MFANLRGPNVRPDLFSYANGAYSDAVIDAVKGMVSCARTTNTGGFPGSGAFQYSRDGWSINRYRMPSYTIAGASTPSAILAAIDGAVPYGAAIEVYGHQADNGDFSTANWTTLLDGIAARMKAGVIDVVTKADMLPLLA